MYIGMAYITSENKTLSKESVSDISRIRLYDKRIDAFRKLVRDKGEEYKVFKWLPYPHYETRVSDTYVLRMVFLSTENFEKDDFSDVSYFVDNGVVCEKPRIVTTYLDGGTSTSWFDTYEEAENMFNNLEIKFNLVKFLVKSSTFAENTEE
jgi:hypothetical protein